MTAGKICTKCGVSKEVAAYGKNKIGWEHLQCRECRAKARREWGAKNKARLAEYQKQWYVKGGRDWHRQHIEENRDQYRLNGRKWHHSNPELAKAKRRREYERRAEKYRADTKRYIKANPEIYRAAARQAKAQRRAATPAWADRKAMRAIYREAVRLQGSDGICRNVDHIIPINGEMVCGLHVENNLRIITAQENLAKSNLFLPELLEAGAAA